jgi:anti-sigma-K factor RskA
MKRWIIGWATATMVLALLVVPASSQQPTQPSAADCKNAPAKVEGQVTSIDQSSGKVTLRATDGTTHQFQASREMLQTMKPGDRLEARLREAPKC